MAQNGYFEQSYTAPQIGNSSTFSYLRHFSPEWRLVTRLLTLVANSHDLLQRSRPSAKRTFNPGAERPTPVPAMQSRIVAVASARRLGTRTLADQRKSQV